MIVGVVAFVFALAVSPLLGGCTNGAADGTDLASPEGDFICGQADAAPDSAAGAPCPQGRFTPLPTAGNPP